MQSVRCFGETKFFRQCPQHLVTPRENSEPCFCWEHQGQREVRLFEVEAQRADTEGAPDWAPMGAFLTNREAAVDSDAFARAPLPLVLDDRLAELAKDDQNVHTAEVQLGVSGSIRRLRAWAAHIKIEKDLPALILHSCTDADASDTLSAALEHLQHCYQWNDDTLMFGVTYPQLASWVWARVDRPHENRELLRERFFEEVAESAGQCLNGNMARLVNVFAAIDLEMSPQEVRMSREQLQHLVSRAVQGAKDAGEAVREVLELLRSANVPEPEQAGWLESVRDAFL